MRYLIILALLGLSACGSAPTTTAVPTALIVAPASTSTAPLQAPSPDTVLIVLLREGGIAGRKETTTITYGGAILTEKSSNTIVYSQASSEATDALRQKIADTGVYNLEPGKYTPKGECCDRFSYDLTLFDRGKQYHYVMSDGASMPPQLADVVGLITGYTADSQAVQ